jgi:hypothetical protein
VRNLLVLLTNDKVGRKGDILMYPMPHALFSGKFTLLWIAGALERGVDPV